MPKSKYPGQLDTSVEIPVVRDNILEIGSDALNSLRSAIFQIERTLGINPQGAVGNSVADRINKALDGNGNILKEALNRANLLSGPVVNADVSKVAGISESKLSLNFPTQLLQDEISIINSQIDEIMDIVKEVSNAFAVHVNTNAINRHPATAISVEGKTTDPGDEATMSLDDGSVQSTFELLYNDHINYTGDSITEDNRSHAAEQIFFDTAGSISSMTDANDVQEVIEDLAASMLNFEINHQDLFHANGILRISRVAQPSDDEFGEEIISSSEVFFDLTKSDGHRISTIIFSDPVSILDFNPERSDIVNITDGDLSYGLEIDSIVISSDGLYIESVDVFGEFFEESTEGAVATVTKNINKKTNNSCLLVTAREYADKTSAYVIQVANPNAVSVTSDGINPEAFTSSSRYIAISIDDGDDVTIDLYNSDVDRQSIDSIVSRINEQAAEDHLNILAYRVDINNDSSELCIVHNLPDDEAVAHTLMVKRSADDAIDDSGFSDIEDKEITALFGANYYIQGRAFNGLDEKSSESDVVFFAGERTIAFSDSSVNLIESGVSIDDLIVIKDSDSDDGSYVISAVREDQIEIDIGQLPTGFSGSSNEETSVVCMNNCLSLENFNFDAISGTFGGMIFDIFMDSNQSLFAAKRLEYDIVTLSTNSLIEIVDFVGELVDGDTFELKVDSTVDGIGASLDDNGEVVYITGDDSYVYLTSGAKNIKLKVLFRSADSISAYIDANSDIKLEIAAFSSVNPDSNLLIARVPFGNFKGRVFGGLGASTTRVFSILELGTTGIEQMSSGARNILSERPLHETRSNGVIYGLEITNPSRQTDDAADFYTFEIQRGVAYVMGERFEVESKTVITDIPSDGSIDKFFILLDEYGNIIFEKADAYCSSPTGDSETCILATVEDSGATLDAVDLRLFINDLDLKVLNSITVSPEPGMGHFSEIGPAIKYAKRFSEAFPNAGVPTVHLKSGVHKVVIDTEVDMADYSTDIGIQAVSDYGVWINFPVNIIGEGHSTVLDIMSIYEDHGEEDDDRTTAGISNSVGLLNIAGPGLTSAPDGNSDVLTNGFVTLKDFRMRLCGVRIWDPAIKDSSGNKLNWGVNIDNVVFDQSEKDGFGSQCWGVILQQNDTNPGDEIGNVSISSCQFLNSHIYTYLWDAADHRNISILNNTFRGSGDGDEDGEDHFAVWVSGSGHIFDCADVAAENNIYFIGNVIADNDGTGDPAYIDPDGNHPWGDRLSRDLTVGGNLIVCGGISLGGADAEAIVWPMYRKRTYFFNKHSGADLDGTEYEDFGWMMERQYVSAPFGVTQGPVLYFLEKLENSYDEDPGGDTVYTKVYWPSVRVFDITYWAGVNVSKVPVLVDVPRGERIVSVEIYRNNTSLPDGGVLGDTLDIELQVWRFTAGITDGIGDSQPLSRVESHTTSYTHTGDIVASGQWVKVTFPDVSVDNNSSGTSLHDKYLLTFGVTFPNAVGATGSAMCKFYKVHVITEVDSLASALGLY